MDILFTPKKIGNLEIKNRFVNSATCESMAAETGDVTDDIIKKYEQLAKGEVGLIITGHMYVHSSGRAFKHQLGIHNDEMIPGLQKLTDAVHKEGGRIAFQISHAGRYSKMGLINTQPMSPSSSKGDLSNYLKKPRQMDESDIEEIIRAYCDSAERVVKAGADGIQLHGAHSYLISQFLSPYFNDRKDKWGGTAEKRFRFLKEIVIRIKDVLPMGMPLLVKINGNDFISRNDIKPHLTKKYAGWLADIAIDAIEISCGSVGHNMMSCRGGAPIENMFQDMAAWKRCFLKMPKLYMEKKHAFKEGYNLKAAKVVKPAIKDIPLLTVGGLRSVAHMRKIIENGYADFISMSRPFIRQPNLVQQIKRGNIKTASCTSCNRCLFNVFNGKPLRCSPKE